MTVTTQTTYNAIGNTESLSDVIYNVSPQDTPFLSAIGATVATGTKHEWQTDEFAAPTTNAAVEGEDATMAAATATKRLANHTQIFTKNGAVSGTQEIVGKKGRRSELQYQLSKRLVEIKKDMELALIGNQAPSAGSATTARKLRPLAGWISTNIDSGTGFKAGTASAAATAGTKRDFTEKMLKDVIQKCYEAGGNPNMIMVSPSKKGFISDTFGGTGDKVTTFRSQDSVTTGNVVEVYQSDFGLLDVVPNRVMKSATAALNNEDKVYIIDPEYWGMAVLRELQFVDIAKTGDSDKFQLVSEITLEARNEASSGAVFDLN